MRAFLICAVLCICLGCDGATMVSGRVVDNNGSPIEDANFIMETMSDDNERNELLPDGYNHQTHQTESDGEYSMGYSHAPVTTRKSRLTVKKPGFDDYSEIITGTITIDNHDIILEKSKEK